MLKNTKVFYFCHLKKLVRPETFGPYYVLGRCLPGGKGINRTIAKTHQVFDGRVEMEASGVRRKSAKHSIMSFEFRSQNHRP